MVIISGSFFITAFVAVVLLFQLLLSSQFPPIHVCGRPATLLGLARSATSSCGLEVFEGCCCYTRKYYYYILLLSQIDLIQSPLLVNYCGSVFKSQFCLWEGQLPPLPSPYIHSCSKNLSKPVSLLPGFSSNSQTLVSIRSAEMTFSRSLVNLLFKLRNENSIIRIEEYRRMGLAVYLQLHYPLMWRIQHAVHVSADAFFGFIKSKVEKFCCKL